MLIIGYGNALRGDDAVGPIAAERLGGLAVHQLTPELAEAIAAAEGVIFLDADATLEPGDISVRVVAAAELGLDHQASPAGLLHLAGTVYGSTPKAWLIGMGGESFDLREGISPAAERAVKRALEAAGELITG